MTAAAPTSQPAARPQRGRPQLPPPARPAGIGAHWWKPVTGSTEQRKRKQKICLRYGCGRPAGAKKCFCPKHHHQAHKERDPISHIYSARKQRAKERGHEWALTLAEFRQWCQETGYHLSTGRTADSASIDRIDPARGYSLDNIASIPYGANFSKHTQPPGGTWSINPTTGSFHYSHEEPPF